MTQAYTPGLISAQRVRHCCRRLLPMAGELLVERGDRVSAEQVVARTLLPGPVIPVNVAQRLSISPPDLPGMMRQAIGSTVATGDLLAQSTGIFGWFKADCPSPATGTIETISHITGQVLLRGAPQAVEVRAWLAGTVTEVFPEVGVAIEAEVTRVQGIFGVGGEVCGPIVLGCARPAEDLTEQQVSDSARGAILIGGGRVTASALRRAAEFGVAAIVTGGIDDQDLRDFLGYDLGVATTGSEKLGLTLILTEGFGDIPMARQTFERLASRVGCAAAVNGATQIRAGVVRPEVVIPWTDEEPGESGRTPPASDSAVGGGRLGAGRSVRIIRDPWFGIIGRIIGLPPEPQVLGSGSKARVVDIELPTGERVVVPRANVELFEH